MHDKVSDSIQKSPYMAVNPQMTPAQTHANLAPLQGDNGTRITAQNNPYSNSPYFMTDTV